MHLALAVSSSSLSRAVFSHFAQSSWTIWLLLSIDSPRRLWDLHLESLSLPLCNCSGAFSAPLPVEVAVFPLGGHWTAVKVALCMNLLLTRLVDGHEPERARFISTA